ncbi:MAG: cytochrome P450 [Pseudorhodobacter sp.]|nr:MAG: cytochrome P450 [Pseudorhodobacter sp.]
MDVAKSDIDVFSDEVLQNPYPYFAELREMAPVVYLAKNNLWAVTRYQGIRDALENSDVFSSVKVAFNDDMNRALTGTSLATDPPEHRQLRKTLMAPLTPRALKGIEDSIGEKAEALVDALVARGKFDAITDMVRVFVREVVSDMIGVQGIARENILRWGEAAFNVLGPMNPRTIQSFPVGGELFHWCASVKQEDLTEGSLGWGIFEAAKRGEIAQESCGAIIHQYVAAGMDTTIASIGNAIAHFAANPQEYAKLVANPSLARSAFNESLRYEPPASLFGRYVKSDVTFEGTFIPGGSQAAVLFAAGNRDPRHYADPDTYKIDRDPADNLAFGYGIHTCAGQGLARIEAMALLTAFAKRVRSFKVATPERVLNNMTRSLSSLPVLEVVTQ